MNLSEKISALIAGISIVLMAIAAGFSYAFVFKGIPGPDESGTFQYLLENKSIYLAGLAGWSVILILDVIVSIALYLFFRKSSSVLSMTGTVLRLLYTVFLGIAIFQLILVLPLLSHSGNEAEIIGQLRNFEQVWTLGLILFGMHLITLGWLSFLSQRVGKALTVLLFLSGLSYVVVCTGKQLNTMEPQVILTLENILALPMALGEILLAIWLIYLGLGSFKKYSLSSFK